MAPSLSNTLYVSAHVVVKRKMHPKRNYIRLVFIDIRERSGMIERKRLTSSRALTYDLDMTTKRKNPYAVALGRRGGKKGGPARAAAMTPEERSKSARKAVLARWAKVKAKTA
jgi:hypothetical protein